MMIFIYFDNFWTGVPVEAAEPRGQGSQHVSEASPSLVQVHCVYGHVWHVQAV